MTTNSPLPYKFVGIKNDADGRAFIRVLRKFAKSNGKCVRLRARGHRFGRLSFQRELPHRYAQTFTAYIESPRIR